MKADGGKGLAQHSFKKRVILQTGELKNMINELLGIQYNIEKARIDGVAKDDYSVDLEAKVEYLVKQMKNEGYKPKPIRRVYIPKDGSNKMRPLGISCYEDKLVKNLISQILTKIYEPKFFNESFGFRPNGKRKGFIKG